MGNKSFDGEASSQEQAKIDNREFGLFIGVLVSSVAMMFVMLFVRFKMFTIVPFLLAPQAGMFMISLAIIVARLSKHFSYHLIVV